MATVQHSVLTTTNLHEPKGAATASAGDVYVADGAGSGAWTQAYQYADIETKESDAVTVSTIGTTAKTLPFASDGQSNGITADAANNRLTLVDAGTYYVSFSISFATTASGDSGLYEFKLMDDGVETGFGCERQMSGSSDAGAAAFIGLITVGAGSHLTVQVESDNGSDTDDIDLYTAVLVAFKVG